MSIEFEKLFVKFEKLSVKLFVKFEKLSVKLFVRVEKLFVKVDVLLRREFFFILLSLDLSSVWSLKWESSDNV